MSTTERITVFTKSFTNNKKQHTSLKQRDIENLLQL